MDEELSVGKRQRFRAMQFSCPQCASNYQIAPEKVGGRTLKMKCRRCGTFIPIRGAPSHGSMAAAPLIEARSIPPQNIGIFPPAPPSLELWHAAILGFPVGPMTREQLEARVLEGSVGKKSFVWSEGMERWRRITEVSSLVALLPLMSELAAPPSLPPPAQVEVQQSEGSPPASPTPSGLSYLLPATGSSMSLIFALLCAVLFGVTMGFVFFGGQKVQIVKEMIEVPGERSALGATEEVPLVREPEKSQEVVLEKLSRQMTKTRGAMGPKAKSTVEIPPENQGTLNGELEGLSGLSDLAGPGQSNTLSPAMKSAVSPLSESQIQTTVSQGQTGVKRGCWDRALSARDQNAPSTARVSVAIVVTPQGTVASATANEDPKGYPGLSSCVASRVRNWSFPPSSGTTTVNVPFVFAAQ